MGQDEYSLAELSLKVTSPHYFRIKLLSTFVAFRTSPQINHHPTMHNSRVCIHLEPTKLCYE